MITEEEIYLEGFHDYPDDIECRSGADALQHLLETLDLRAELERARAAVGSPAWGSLERAEKRVALLERYVQHGVQPASLMLPVLPIVPRALRMPGTPGADLDALYHRVLQASTRLSLMHKVSAPVMVERHQRENLTRCIEALFANGRGGRLFTADDGPDDEYGEPRPLSSLSELLRSLSIDISGVFEGHRVSIEASDEAAAALRGVALRLVAP